MLWEKTRELFEKLEERRESGISSPELHIALHRLGETALEEGDLYKALNVYMELNDRVKVRIVGDRCIQEGWYCDGNRAFEFLNDRGGILRVIQEADGKDSAALETALESYLGSRTVKAVYEGFEQWASERRMNGASVFNLASIANMAHCISSKYDLDLGVGIERGGLFAAYIFNLFGVPVKIAQCHRRGKGATFNWVDETSREELEGKNIVVFDNDVVSGRTTRRVLTEIQKYKPRHMALVLVHDPIPRGTIGIGTVSSNIPSGYNDVYYPKKFNYQRFDNVVERLEQNLRGD